jgi:hypothetical protein
MLVRISSRSLAGFYVVLRKSHQVWASNDPQARTRFACGDAWGQHGLCMGHAWAMHGLRRRFGPMAPGYTTRGRAGQPFLQGYLLYRKTLPGLVKTTRVRGAVSGQVSGEVEGWSPADRFQEVAAANFATAQGCR